MGNPVDSFIQAISKVESEGDAFYTDAFRTIDEHLGTRYEGARLEMYLNDIRGHGYQPKELKSFLIELARTVDRTDRGEDNG